MGRVAIAMLAMGAGALLLSRQAAASAREPDAVLVEPDRPAPVPVQKPDPEGDAWGVVLPEWGSALFADAWGLVGGTNELAAVDHAQQELQAHAPQADNLAAFLTMISFAEGTARAGDPYRVCYAYSHTIASMSDHPAVTGEWRGMKLSDGMCQRAGYGPGCISTAAGRYQLVKPTWLRAKRALSLVDFGPAAQDAAAIWLVIQRGALDAVNAGDLERAVQLCRPEWASLPGSDAGQPQRRMGELVAAYESAGGVLA